MVSVAKLEEIAQARNPVEIFGNLGEPPGDKRRTLELRFRQLRREVHPDVNDCAEIATAAFQNLEALRAQAVFDLEYGIYGQPPSATITTRRHGYRVLQPLPPVGAAHCYACLIHDECRINDHNYNRADKTERGLFTIAQRPFDNDLLQAEAKVIRFLRELDRPEAEGYRAMLPDIVESFVYSEADDVERQVNTFRIVPGYVSLATIQEAYPHGIDPRDMAWMWRRLLDLLGYAHSRGIIHGAVLPPNVLIGLGDLHEVVLFNWQAATGRNWDDLQDLGVSHFTPCLDTTYKGWYPPEVLAKQSPAPGTDILMSARCMIALLGGDPLTGSLPAQIHSRIAGFLKSCLIVGVSQRPQDAWKLRAEFTELIDQLWGTRQYRPFTMPSNS